MAVALHERAPGDTFYANWAQREWAWFQGSGMLTGSHLVIDGLAACRPDLSSPTWTYNQGVLIGGLVALARMTGSREPLATAQRIAGAVMDSQALSPHGILRDPCEPSSCDEDQPLFKGIFMKNLKLLADQIDQAGRASYRQYLRHNAVAVWSNDRRGDEFGLSWSGPFDSASTAKQTSALDVLNTQVSAHPAADPRVRPQRCGPRRRGPARQPKVPRSTRRRRRAPPPRAAWHPGWMTTAGQAASAGRHRPAPGPGGRPRLEAPADPGALAGPGALADRTPADLGSPPSAAGSEETISRLQQAMGSLGTAAMMSMEQRLPWFRSMSAENRSWIGLVAQAGIAAFVDWVKHPERSRSAVAGEVFGTAPRELARAVSLQQVVEMVRVTIDVVEARVDELAAPGGEAELREAVLHYTREVAFAAAQVYARTAEASGAWDARLEALVVDSLVRGEIGEGMHSWASALNWSSAPVAVIVGTAEGDEPEGLIDELRVTARRARLDLLAGVQGNKLVVVIGGTDDPLTAAQPVRRPVRRRARWWSGRW